MRAAREQAYDRIDDVIVPNLYYRDDIGERWIDSDGDHLQAWGYLGPPLHESWCDLTTLRRKPRFSPHQSRPGLHPT